MKERPDSRRWALGSDGWRRGLIGLAVVVALLTLLFAAQSLAGPGKPRETRREEAETPAPPGNVTTPSEAAPPASGRRWTDGASAERTSHAAASSDGMPSQLRVGATLLGVIGLAVAAGLFAKRWLTRQRLAPRLRQLELEDALALGPRRHVYLVRLRNRLLVLGAGAEEISLLAEFDDDDPVESRDVPMTSQPAVRRSAPNVPNRATTEPRAEVAASSPELRRVDRVPEPFRHLLQRALEKEAAE